MGIRLLAGREFTDWDTASSERVVIINEALAKKLYPDGQSIGTRLTGVYGTINCKVVGVAGSARLMGIDDVQPEVYFPYTQGLPDSFSFIARAPGKSPDFIAAARKAIRDADGFQPIAEANYVENYIDRSMTRPRSLAALVSGFAFLGYLLVLVGVYGAISHAVNGRIREYGIRLAMGAEPLKLWRKAILSSLPPLLAGIAAGAFLAWYAGRLLQSEAQGVNTGDPAALILFSLALLITALASGAFASRRILRVDPITVLRHE